jgi:hypothetical protein
MAQQAAAKKAAGAKRAAIARQGSRFRGKAAGPGGYATESARVSARAKLARDTRAGARKGHKSAAGKRSQARRDAAAPLEGVGAGQHQLRAPPQLEPWPAVQP